MNKPVMVKRWEEKDLMPEKSYVMLLIVKATLNTAKKEMDKVIIKASDETFISNYATFKL